MSSTADGILFVADSAIPGLVPMAAAVTSELSATAGSGADVDSEVSTAPTPSVTVTNTDAPGLTFFSAVCACFRRSAKLLLPDDSLGPATFFDDVVLGPVAEACADDVMTGALVFTRV